jgi:hypothetical protein
LSAKRYEETVKASEQHANTLRRLLELTARPAADAGD